MHQEATAEESQLPHWLLLNNIQCIDLSLEGRREHGEVEMEGVEELEEGVEGAEGDL